MTVNLLQQGEIWLNGRLGLIFSKRSEKMDDTRRILLWRKLMCQVLMYGYARMLASISASIFANFRSLREPGIVAPSVQREANAAKVRVTRAEQQLVKARVKEAVMAKMIAKAKEKAKGKASSHPKSVAEVKSKPSTGPPPQSTSSGSGASSSWGTGTISGVGLGTGSKERLVATGYASESTSTGTPPPIMSMDQIQKLLAMASAQGMMTADMTAAYMNPGIAQTQYFSMASGQEVCVACGVNYALPDNEGCCGSCQWMMPEEQNEEEADPTGDL